VSLSFPDAAVFGTLSDLTKCVAGLFALFHCSEM